MVKYIGPKLKIKRRLGNLVGLFNKKSCRLKSPGEHGKKNYPFLQRSFLSSNYKKKFIEKQKIRYSYGITEKQLYYYYKNSKKQKRSTEFSLLQILESRLDCLIFRFGFACTMAAARQYVNHGHILVNDKIINIPSFLCLKNDIISIKYNSKIKNLIENNIKNKKKKLEKLEKNFKENKFLKINSIEILPAYLYLDEKNLYGKILKNISPKNIKLDINPLKIIEYYSR